MKIEIWTGEVEIMEKSKIIVGIGVLGIMVVIVGFFLYGGIRVFRDTGDKNSSAGIDNRVEEPTSELKEGDATLGYTSITMAEAKEIFETDGDYIILDVRRADEFEAGHIPGAINVANEDINNRATEALPDKNRKIYVYCRSGNRSKQASAKLVAMGYTDIVEFGGILDWPGEIEK